MRGYYILVEETIEDSYGDWEPTWTVKSGMISDLNNALTAMARWALIHGTDKTMMVERIPVTLEATAKLVEPVKDRADDDATKLRPVSQGG